MGQLREFLSPMRETRPTDSRHRSRTGYTGRAWAFPAWGRVTARRMRLRPAQRGALVNVRIGGGKRRERGNSLLTPAVYALL